MRRLWIGITFGLLALLSMSLIVSAQDNKLTNGGMEEGSFGAYRTHRGGEHPIYLPAGWNIWMQSPTGEYLNRDDRTAVNAHPGPGPDPKQGSRAINVDCGFVTCTTVLYQQVAVDQNTNVQASAWAQVKACNIPSGGTTCGSAVESGAQTRIGIDPNGGTNPRDTDIVWSGWAQPHDQWQQMNVSATTTGTTVTLFLESTQGSTAHLNKTYWDDAVLTGGGSGGSAPGSSTAVPTVPPPPANVPFVAPQGAREDGSLVHVVRDGDTLDSIAVAYGVTRTELMDLNSILSPSLIRLGQEIIVRPANAAPPAPEPTAVPPVEQQPQEQAPVAQPTPELDLTYHIPSLISPDDSFVSGQTQKSLEQGLAIQRFAIVTALTPKELLTHYDAQLQAAGWQLISSESGAGHGWSSWQFMDSNGVLWGASVSLSSSAVNVGQYSVLIEIEQANG